MRQSRSRLRARALKASRSFMVKPHNLQSPEGAETRCMLMWISGYEAARRDMVKAARRPTASAYAPPGFEPGNDTLRLVGRYDTITGTMHPVGDDVLTIPALSAEADAIRDGKHAGVSVGYNDPRRPHGTCLACGRATRANGMCTSDECPGLGGSYGT